MPNEYYRYKHARRTNDLRYYVEIVVVTIFAVLVVGLFGRCCQEDTASADIAQLTQAQKAEVMSRLEMP